MEKREIWKVNNYVVQKEYFGSLAFIFIFDYAEFFNLYGIDLVLT